MEENTISLASNDDITELGKTYSTQRVHKVAELFALRNWNRLLGYSRDLMNLLVLKSRESKCLRSDTSKLVTSVG